MYTISCHALNIQITKSQKKTIKRFNNYDFSATSTITSDSCRIGEDHQMSLDSEDPITLGPPNHELVMLQDEPSTNPSLLQVNHKSPQTPFPSSSADIAGKKPPPGQKPPKPPADNHEKTLEELITENIDLKTKSILVGTTSFEETFELEHALYVKYQVAVHGDKESDVNKKQFKRFLCDTPINVRQFVILFPSIKIQP
jgi:arginine-tRNA-protein transferase